MTFNNLHLYKLYRIGYSTSEKISGIIQSNDPYGVHALKLSPKRKFHILQSCYCYSSWHFVSRQWVLYTSGVIVGCICGDGVQQRDSYGILFKPLKQYGDNLGYVLREELILFLLVSQILGKHTINYFQIVKVKKCMGCTKNGVSVMAAILN